MVTPEPGFPDAEKVMIALVSPVAEAGTVTPAELGERVPFIQVQRTGGTDDGITDRPLIEVTVLADTREEARQLAEQVRQRVLAAAGEEAGGVLIDYGRANRAAIQLPYENPDLRRITAGYQLSLRRHYP